MNFNLQPNRLLNVGEKLTRQLLNQLLSGITGTISGLVQFSEMATSAVRSGNSVPGPYWFSTGSYSAGVYALSLNAAYTAYAEGDEIVFRADSANAAGAANVNANGIGSKDLLKENGRELEIGDIPSGWIVTARYNGTAFQVLSVSAKPVLIRGGTFTNGATVNDFQMTLTPGTLTLPLLVGLEIEGVVLADTTGPVNIIITPSGSAALASKALVKKGDVALAFGDLAAGQYIRFMWDGTNYQLLTPTAGSVSAPTVGAANLKVVASAGNSATVTADEMVLKDASGNKVLLTSVNTSADIDAAGNGAGKLDVGSVAGSTAYYLFVVYNQTAGTTSAMWSLSSSAPSFTNATGYAFYALVHASVTTAGVALPDFRQYGRDVWLTENIVAAATAGVTTGQNLALTACVPPIATSASGYIETTTNVPLNVKFESYADNWGTQVINQPAAGAVNYGSGAYTAAAWRVPITNANTQIVWHGTAAVNYNLVVTGYTLP